MTVARDSITILPEPSLPPLSRNKLLAVLPDAERALLGKHATFVPLKRRDLLYETERPAPYVYFLVEGIASLLSVMTDGTGVETATIGREGMVGMGVFHGVLVTPEQAMVQVPGGAYRIPSSAFREILPSLPTLDTLLHRFSVVMFTLAAQNSGCNRKHAVEARCARWLLMVADRVDTEILALTHDFVAQMLGVRRASVTEALGALERRGLIETGRGRIGIVNRPGLEGVACECYSIIRGTVQRLLQGCADTSPLAAVKASEDGKSTLREPHD
ncbi:MAG: family transcriptional regulator [Gemmatimonadetes bacterium]|nr:family transcriptional regulator [Gemmatimonadota bacterium]